ncbi:MAG: NAD-dependent epimerase/dehydratase family protein [Candidatus Woykebacteria bacterium]
MKKVLVTGAAGFIGSNLVGRLLKESYYVVGIDNFITGEPKNIRKFSGDSNFKFIRADIVNLDAGQVEDLIHERFSEIYHLACPTGVPNLVTLAEEMLLTCSVGTRNILEIARKSGSKFLFTSSSEVYGDPKVFPQEESYSGNVDPIGIRSPYEEGKRLAESLVIMYVRKYGLRGKIVRVFNTYGPNMSEKDERIIPKYIQQIKKGAPLTVHGDGTQMRTFCHVADLVNGLLLVMREGKNGEPYNIGGVKEIAVKDLAQTMIRLFSSKVGISYVKRPAHDHQSRRPDLTKISSLGWSPSVGLEDGLSRLIIISTSQTVR